MAFSFIQITDHHLRESDATLTRGYSTWHAFRAVLRHIAQHHPTVDFIVSTGDLVNSGDDGDLGALDVNAQYQYLRRALQLDGGSAPPGPLQMSAEGLHAMPFYVLPGNLDPREAFFANLFPSAAPCAMNVTFRHKGVQFVCVDWGPAVKAAATPEMLALLGQALRGETPSIILAHHHVAPCGLPLWDSWIADNIESFWDAVQGRRVWGIFSGHAHVTYEARVRDVPVFGLRSTSYAYTQQGAEVLPVLRAPHYRVVNISGDSLSTTIEEVTL